MYFSVADASVALGRIGSFLTAEELADPYKIDSNNPYAIHVDGDFQWETSYKASTGGPKFKTGKPAANGEKKAEKPKEKGAKRRSFFGKKEPEAVLPTADKKEGDGKKGGAGDEDKPFQLANLKLQIPKGSFVAIVGRVGSGKVWLVFEVVGKLSHTR